jgi:VanZ family protein
VGRRRPYFWLLAGWVALTLTLTSIPNPTLPIDVPQADKLAHLGFYGVIGCLFALWRRESGDSRHRAILRSALFVAFLGAFDEAHQQFIPGRSMDLLDWVADAAGGGAGAASAGVLPLLFPFLLTR